MGRSHSERRCPRCQLFAELCLCPEVKPEETRTQVLALMHVRELPLTTNTVRLLQLMLKNIEVRLRGQRDAGEVDLKDVLNNERVQPLFLFPSAKAIPLNEFRLDPLRRPLLIVPDGNWRQAAKVSKRVAGLDEIPHVSLPLGLPSEYRLRKEPRESCLSTFEAVSRALAILEQDEGIEGRLMRIFRMKVDRTLWARGQLPADQVRGGVPVAAIQSFHEAGKRGSSPA